MAKRSTENLHIRELDPIQVRVLLAKRGWTVSDLARAMGAGISTVHEVLQRKSPTAPTALKIADTLGVPMRRIIRRVPKPQPEQQQAA